MQVALKNASTLSLNIIKEFCLKFIIKESNYNQVLSPNKIYVCILKVIEIKILKVFQGYRRMKLFKLSSINSHSKFIWSILHYQIVMSQEFETLDQPLMVEIIRRRQIPPEAPSSNSLPSSFFSSNNVSATPGTALKEDMQRYIGIFCLLLLSRYF